MTNKEYNEIQEVVFLNYEDLRSGLVSKYNTYTEMRKDHASIFDMDITKQFVDMVHSYVTHFISVRTVLSVEVIKIFVQDAFTFDNIERIISDDGAV